MQFRWGTSSLVVAGFGWFAAFTLSFMWIEPAHSQTPPAAEAPSDGSLPPEFAKEMGVEAPPAANAAPIPSVPEQNQTPPPPISAPSIDPGMASGTALSSEEYVYDPTGRRDPFRPYRLLMPQGKNKEPIVGDLEPLQKYELEQLTVVGILWGVRQPRALVRDPESRVHTLVKNTKLGRNAGYVAAIREGEIVVVETIDQEGGTQAKRTRVLELKK